MNLIRHLIGYTVGAGMFLVGIPAGIYYLSRALEGSLGLAPFWDPVPRLIVALPLLAVGVLFMLWSNLFLFTKGEGGPADAFGVAISPRSQKLVVTGPYRYTRNPMVFGALAAYSAVAVFLGSLGVLILLAALVILVIVYLKRVEEEQLVAQFGDEYREYRNQVSMIIPLPRKKVPRTRTLFKL